MTVDLEPFEIKYIHDNISQLNIPASATNLVEIATLTATVLAKLRRAANQDRPSDDDDDEIIAS